MKLKTIVLIGFKSFAKRTEIKLDTGIMAVVGPNGCGKSNIVDALRWVMGESRATQLRQEVNTDIIFNGTATNRAADWCSVELQLANDKSRDLGMWSDYAEISVRRQIERDGQSNYYINGQRVRRRDVVDLFSGTGSGARSYGIVEQERITQVVRAEPKRIRMHLEEAAGVAIYKERRRETESRIEVSEANISRLEDTIRELQRQLEALAKQAKTTAQIRKTRSKLEVARQLELIMRHEELIKEYEVAKVEVSNATAKSKTIKSEYKELESKIKSLNQKRNSYSNQINKLQAKHYDALAEKDKHEQGLKDYEAETKRDREALVENEQEATELNERTTELTKNQTELKDANAKLTKEHAEVNKKVEQCNKEFQVVQSKMQGVQSELAAAEAKYAKALQEENDLQANVQVIKHRIADLNKTIKTTQHELDNLEPVTLFDEIYLNKLREDAKAARKLAIDNEQQRQELVQEVAEEKEELVRLQGEQGALTAEKELLEKISGQLKEKYAKWFKEHNINDTHRLVESAGIDAVGLEKAVDAALGALVDGYEVSDLKEVLNKNDIPDGLVLLDPKLAAKSKFVHGETPAGLAKLTDVIKVKDNWQNAVNHWLHGVYLANSHELAIKTLPQLAVGEMIVTPQGISYIAGAVSSNRDQKSGVEWSTRLAKVNNKIIENKSQIDQVIANHEKLNQDLAVITEKSSQSKVARENIDKNLEVEEKEAIRCKHAVEYHEQQTKRLTTTINQVNKDIQANEAKLLTYQEQLSNLQNNTKSYATNVDSLKNKFAGIQSQIESAREVLNSHEKELNEVNLNLSLNKQENNNIEERLVEAKIALAKSRTNIVKFQTKLKERDTTSLEENIKKAQLAVNDANEAVKNIESQSKELDQEQLAQEAKLQEMNERIENDGNILRELEINAATKKAEADGIWQQITAKEFAQEEIDELRKTHATMEKISSLVAELDKRIERAGPINYAAEAEHTACEERIKEQQAQFDDLTSALVALKDAIKKIDTEMLDRIKDVYTNLNIKFDAVFKQLFSGGSASIELEGDDFLTAEMVLKVSPPGKRISNLHALSGGEKTLTALAFIFALNELNTPPYCVLDEVDAALDDANTARFCRLLDSLKNRTQFMVVTHNKQVIENADRLVGVTQEEKGITKLVSVHLDEALAQAQRADGTTG